MWKLDGSKPLEITESGVDFEEFLENYVKLAPRLVDNEILIIGQQVVVEGVNDRIDLLALDKDGSAVIIEVKRAQVSDPTDLQAVKYASYVSNWGREVIKALGERYYKIPENNDLLSSDLCDFADFDEIIEGFCNDEYYLNHDQRIILVGTDFSKKVLSTLLWMSRKGIRIKAVEIHVYTDNNNSYLVPKTVFPLPKHEDLLVGTSARTQEDLWKIDSTAWHIIKVCSDKTSGMLVSLVDHLESIDEDIIVSWDQQQYVGVKVNRILAVWISTFKNHLWIRLRVPGNSFSENDIAGMLELEESQIIIDSEENWDRVKFKLSPEDKYNSEGFKELASKAIQFLQSA